MILKPSAPTALNVRWDPLPDDFVLPDDPVENILQPFLAAALTEALDTAGKVKPEMLLASNFGLVSTVNHRTVVKAPDWVYVPRVNPVNYTRRSYTQHLEGDAIAIVMEFLSETETGEYSSRPEYPYGKLYYYEKILKVPTYVIFSPPSALLEVRRLEGGDTASYTLQSANSQGRYWIPELELFLGVWNGERAGISANWLRWWDQAGNLLLWGSETIEKERNIRLQSIRKLLGMGLTPEQVAEALSLSVEDINPLY